MASSVDLSTERERSEERGGRRNLDKFTSSSAPRTISSAASQSVVTYLPDNSLRQGYVGLLKAIVDELVSARFLMLQLFKRDVVSLYKQSLLGALWIVFIPLVTVGTFVLLQGSGVVSVGRLDAPYPVYAVLGTAIWQLFAQGIVAGANSLVLGGDLVTRINFSKKALVIASLGRTVVSFVVLLALSAVVIGGYVLGGYAWHPQLGLMLLPLVLLPTLLLTLGVSFCLALLNGVVRDIGNLLPIAVTFFMLLTPVLYERPVLGPGAGLSARALGAVTDYNPLYYLVSAPRELVLRGSLGDFSGFCAASAVSVLVFVLGLIGFHLAETRIAERI